MKEWERRHAEYVIAKKAFDAAERVYLTARADLDRAQRERGDEWNKLVQAATRLPPQARKKVAEEQFG